MPSDPTPPWSRRQTFAAWLAVLGFLALVYIGGHWDPDTTRPDPPQEEYEREWGR